MVRISNRTLADSNFRTGFLKLASVASFPIGTALKLSRLTKTLMAAGEEMNELQQKILERFAERDEKGVMVQPNPGQFKLADVAGYEAARTELLAVEHEFDFLPIPIQMLENAKSPDGQPLLFTPVEVSGLECLISELKAV